MESNRYAEIDEAIAYIHRNIYDPLPLNQLASHVGYSPFHFTRIFKERIGLSPLYYASSIRLQKAKDLLLRTNLGIRDIGLEIGQQSLGTFTTRFTERVGVTPSQFRNSTIEAENHLNNLQKLKDWQPRIEANGAYATVEGSVRTEVPISGVVLIGLFAKPIPEGFPLYGTLIPSHGEFRLTDVRPGTYYLMATSVLWGMQAVDFLLPHTTLRTRSKEPITVHAGSSVPYQQVTLHPPLPDDPPILVSLSLLMNHFLNQVLQISNR
ncbi:helix-turn-helix domain-containing protein [Cohnella herbarum]|uniref:Helix-turn-helix transcriptional regulator n=1 Tax=Cohnella herbarum TaxID=2728023 RepID=A0A7Z2ZKD5_9BACL|nr:AraC family transcriptional regulator [Cohnella herbarum]QJD83076.1 helix-turn-helix transcriptional regulator [Cohnella herbarum]